MQLYLEGNSGIVQTDGNGNAVISATPGQRDLYSFKTGFVASADLATIVTGTNTTLTVRLKPGNTLDVIGINVATLSPAEISSRGLNVPEGYSVYTYTLMLNVDITKTVEFSNVVLPERPISGTTIPIPEQRLNVPNQVGVPYTVSGSVNYTSDDGDKVETFIIIPGEIKFLKQFWDASIYLNNDAVSSSITITQVQAKLDVPAGLKVVDANGESQSNTQVVGSIPANQGKKVNWTVRGDAVGSYTLSALATGQIQFAGVSNTIPLTVTATSPTLEVVKPQLLAQYAVPAGVTAGITFTLGITLSNYSPIGLNNLTVSIYPDKLVNALPGNGETPDRNITYLPINGSATISYNIVPLVSGCFVPSKSKVEVAADTILTPQLIFLPLDQCGGTNPPGADQIGHVLGLEDCNCPIADPISPATGNYVESFTDLTWPTAAGSALGMTIVRTYNSLDTTTGLFGTGWHFTFDMSMWVTATDNSLTVINANGRRDRYTTTDGTTYIAPSRANATLSKAGANYTLTTAEKVVYTFNSSGKLTAIADRNNNQITLNYSGSILTSVSDSYGRSFTFTVSNNLITSIVDNSGSPGRAVSYEYSGGKLTVVTDTIGTAVRYGYDSVTGLLDRRYDQNNNLVMQNTYDSQHRVTSQVTYAGNGVSYTGHFD